MPENIERKIVGRVIWEKGKEDCGNAVAFVLCGSDSYYLPKNSRARLFREFFPRVPIFGMVGHHVHGGGIMVGNPARMPNILRLKTSIVLLKFGVAKKM